jgi:hypothetical protein
MKRMTTTMDAMDATLWRMLIDYTPRDLVALADERDEDGDPTVRAMLASEALEMHRIRRSMLNSTTKEDDDGESLQVRPR